MPARELKLTTKQKLWAKLYVVDFNASKAAIGAGYKAKGATNRGYELTHNYKVMRYVDTLLEKLNKKLEVNALYVRKRLIEIDTLNIRDILESDGSILPVIEWPEQWGRSLSGIDVTQSRDGGSTVTKIRWPEKLKTLELLGRHISVNAWGDGPALDTEEAMPLQISFDSAEPKGDVRTTNANP